YPGRTIGYELVYPKTKMTEITAHLRGAQVAEVQTAKAESETVMPPAEESTMAQNTESEVQREKPAEVTPAEPEITPAPAVSEESKTTATEQNNNAPAELPKTAGELPMI